MEVTVEVLTRAFENACFMPYAALHRKFSVENQWQRNVWEVTFPRLGLLRIENIGKCRITLFPERPNIYNVKKTMELQIDLETYFRLEKIYYGDFKLDEERWNDLNNSYLK